MCGSAILLIIEAHFSKLHQTGSLSSVMLWLLLLLQKLLLLLKLLLSQLAGSFKKSFLGRLGSDADGAQVVHFTYLQFVGGDVRAADLLVNSVDSTPPGRSHFIGAMHIPHFPFNVFQQFQTESICQESALVTTFDQRSHHDSNNSEGPQWIIKSPEHVATRGTS